MKKSENGKPAQQKQSGAPEHLPPQAVFFNHMTIAHSPEEFYFEIGQLIHGTNIIGITNRFVTTVSHAKRIRDALTENIKRYESKFGRISEPKTKSKPKRSARGAKK